MTENMDYYCNIVDIKLQLKLFTIFMFAIINAKVLLIVPIFRVLYNYNARGHAKENMSKHRNSYGRYFGDVGCVAVDSSGRHEV